MITGAGQFALWQPCVFIQTGLVARQRDICRNAPTPGRHPRQTLFGGENGQQ